MIPIIGIDPSLTGVGIAAYLPREIILDNLTTISTPEQIKVTTIASSVKDGGGASPARWEKIAGGVFEWLLKNICDVTRLRTGPPSGLVMMEGIPLGTVTGNVIDLASMRAILAYGLYRRGYLLVDHKQIKNKVYMAGRGISPTSVKSFALGKGGGAGTNKDAMVIAATTRFPDVKFTNNNEADALWLMQMAITHYLHPFRIPPHPDETERKLEALETIDWPEL